MSSPEGEGLLSDRGLFTNPDRNTYRWSPFMRQSQPHTGLRHSKVLFPNHYPQRRHTQHRVRVEPWAPSHPRPYLLRALSWGGPGPLSRLAGPRSLCGLSLLTRLTLAPAAGAARPWILPSPRRLRRALLGRAWVRMPLFLM